MLIQKLRQVLTFADKAYLYRYTHKEHLQKYKGDLFHKVSLFYGLQYQRLIISLRIKHRSNTSITLS